MGPIEIISLADLKENPHNCRSVSDERFEALRRSIAEFPQMMTARQMVVRRSAGVVLGGNLRLRALKANGVTEIPDEWVRWVEWSDADCDRFHVVDNENVGEWIADELLALYGREKLSAWGLDIESLLESVSETDESEGKTDPDAVPEPPPNPVSRPGCVYSLGSHVLVCGDTLDPATLAKLCPPESVDLILTDPPYNVDYHGVAGSIANDSMSDDAFLGFLSTAFRTADARLKPGGVFYVWHAATEIPNFYAAAKAAGWQVRQQLVWIKNQFVMGRQDYHWQHKPCMYGWKSGAAHYFVDDRTQSTVTGSLPPGDVIPADRPVSSDLHPTMKPVELLVRLVRNSTRPGETVMDPFGGSGSTLVACEQTGRRCLTAEIEPKFCDVIRRRWAEYMHGEGCAWETLTPEINAAT